MNYYLLVGLLLILVPVVSAGDHFIISGPITNTGNVTIINGGNGTTGYQSCAAGWCNDSSSTDTDLPVVINSGVIWTPGSIDIGDHTMCLGGDQYSINIGRDTASCGLEVTSIGYFTQVTGPGAVAVGAYARAISDYSNAWGYFSTAFQPYCNAFGVATACNHANSTAIGRGTETTAEDQLMIGAEQYPYNTIIHGNLSTTREIYELNNSRVCTATNGLCATSVPYQSSAAGWTNTSTTTTTNLNAVINQNLTVMGNSIFGSSPPIPNHFFRIAPSYTTTATTARIMFVGGTLYNSNSGMAGIAFSPNIAPTANVGIIYGTIGLSALAASIYNVTAYYVNFYRGDTTATYNGTIGTMYSYYIANPTLANGSVGTQYGMYIEDLADARVGTTYGLYVNDRVGFGGDTSPDAQLDIQPETAATTGLIVQAAASQTANLTEWKNSAGTTLASVNATGSIFLQSWTVPAIDNVSRIMSCGVYQNGTVICT